MYISREVSRCNPLVHLCSIATRVFCISVVLPTTLGAVDASSGQQELLKGACRLLLWDTRLSCRRGCWGRVCVLLFNLSYG